MVLATNPSTGSLIGLSRSVSRLPVLEAIRKSNSGNDSKWLAAVSAFGIAYRAFNAYRFHKKYPECPARVLARLVSHGMEDYGRFLIEDTTKTAFTLLSEVRLLLTCGCYTLLGNSVRYEFGYRWFHQTSFSDDFKSNYLDLLSVSPVLSAGSTLQQHALHDSLSDISPDLEDGLEEAWNDDSRIRRMSLDSNVEMDCDLIQMYGREDEFFTPQEYSALVDDAILNGVSRESCPNEDASCPLDQSDKQMVIGFVDALDSIPLGDIEDFSNDNENTIAGICDRMLYLEQDYDPAMPVPLRSIDMSVSLDLMYIAERYGWKPGGCEVEDGVYHQPELHSDRDGFISYFTHEF